MIGSADLCGGLLDRGLKTFTGVPCSHLGGPIEYLTERRMYVPAPNEGSALAFAAGSELAGQRAAVLLQNSGLGNLINPLTSLLLPFEIPVLALISLRGWPEPVSDEPQHSVIGPATMPILELLGVDHWLLPESVAELPEVLDRIDECHAEGRPAALLVPRGAISKAATPSDPPAWTTSEALRGLLPLLADHALFAATGYIAREVFAAADRDDVFYMQGAMGHALSLALGAAAAQPTRAIGVIDGEGAVLMHMGATSTAGALAPSNLLHVIVDNHSYESTGGQASVSGTVDWVALARSVGYRSAFSCADPAELEGVARAALSASGPVALVLEVDPAVAGAPPPRATSALDPRQVTIRFSSAITDGKARGTAPARRRHQTIHCHTGAIDRLGPTLRALGAESVLLVASEGALERTGALGRLDDFTTHRFDAFEPNPKVEEGRAAAALAERHRVDAVVGIGGASTLDVAKLARLLPSADSAFDAALSGEEAALREPAPRLVLVPTTAGPGAEVTQFATVYAGERKRSLDHPRARADVVLVDSDLLHTCPGDLFAACALDGLAQSIESVLSVRSTVRSRQLALAALPAFVAILPQIDRPSPRTLREASEASVAIGQAINISRTTAGHAFSYPTTIHHGVPHGVASALHLTWLIPYLVGRLDQHCRDPRGSDFVHDRLAELGPPLGAGSEAEIGRRIAELIGSAGISPRLADHGIAARDVGVLVAEALGSDRAANSPVAVDPEDAAALLQAAA
jgi:phosphonopyruvate decarboxylase